MSHDLEREMLQRLDGTFATYVGKPESPDGLGFSRRSDLENFYHAIEKAARRPPKIEGPLSMESILRAVAAFFDVPKRDLLEKSGFPEHSHARQIFVWLCRRHLSVTYEALGAFSNRHHSTLIYTVQKLDRQMDAYRADIAAIEKIMGVGIGVP